MKTPEEIKQLAIECYITPPEVGNIIYLAILSNLQAFYQRAYEEGRKMQRESDTLVAARVNFVNPSVLSSAEAHMWDMAKIAAMEAIRHNTGE